FLDAGLRIPDDVSVIGFDDIQSAAFHNPSLTTIRQPLREMGEAAARLLVERLTDDPPFPSVVTLETELVVRRSTGPAPSRWRVEPGLIAERVRRVEQPGAAAE
ncbi:MAG: substrate-binding domain-containing protein, partial [Acidobacteriota bacterium]